MTNTGPTVRLALGAGLGASGVAGAAKGLDVVGDAALDAAVAQSGAPLGREGSVGVTGGKGSFIGSSGPVALWCALVGCGAQDPIVRPVSESRLIETRG
jgi:hypothetical protein